MRRRLLIHPEALLEAEAAIEWYRDRSERAAIDFVTEVAVTIRRLSEHPAHFPVTELGVRSAILRRFPYAIVFRVTGRDVQVVAIAHSRRQPNYWKDRLS